MSRHDNYFITGAAGFVGACLTRHLVERGYNVSVLIKPRTNLWRIKGIISRIKIFEGDLTDESRLSKILREVKPTVIYHLATHGAYPFQNDAHKIITSNVLGTWNLLKASSAFNYKTFVNTGSSSEYGFKKKPMKETDLLEPNSYYAVAKSAQSLLCQYVARSQRKPICTFRLFSVYGPYEESTRLIPTLIRSCLTGQDLQMVSPKTARDFIFIDDVIRAYCSLENLKNLYGDILNIGTGKQSSLKSVVEKALQLSKAKIKVKWGTMPSRIWDSDVWVAHVKKTQQLLKWKATTTLTQGLSQTIAFQNDNLK